MAARPANFPDAFIRLLPVRLQELEQGDLYSPGCRLRFQAGGSRQMQRVHDFAVDIELELLRCRVAHAHRSRAAIAGQPAHLVFIETPLARDAVEYLQILGTTRHGAQQPLAPGDRFFVVAGEQQRVQRERGIAQPAVTVVPVAHTALLLRQRSRGRRDDPSGGRIGQRLQRDQRAHYGIAPASLVGAAFGPFAPLVLGCRQRLLRVDGLLSRFVRRTVVEREWHPLALAHVKLGHGFHVFAADGDRRCAVPACPALRSPAACRPTRRTQGTMDP